MLLLLLILLVIASRAAEIKVTITGTMRSGEDTIGVFGVGQALANQPFTLVFTFDDTVGQAIRPSCGNNGSGIVGTGAASPATAVITINGVSHEFGVGPNAVSSAWRSIASFCSSSELRFQVNGGKPGTGGVNVTIHPAQGANSLTQNPDWRGALSTTTMDRWAGLSAFSFSRDFNHWARGAFYFNSVTIAKR
jgi:hypothetical protein